MQDRFKQLVEQNIKREGVVDLMKFIESSDFYTAPASTKFHDSEKGGLCSHSLDVYDHLILLDKAYDMHLPLESMTIVSLFHDLCKINCYEVDTKNVKGKDGTWHAEPFYKFNEKNKYGGHGSKSVYIVQYYMKLSFDEAAAINCHMGIENGDSWSIMDAFRVNPLAFLLHVADMASTVPDVHTKMQSLKPGN